MRTVSCHRDNGLLRDLPRTPGNENATGALDVPVTFVGITFHPGDILHADDLNRHAVPQVVETVSGAGYRVRRPDAEGSRPVRTAGATPLPEESTTRGGTARRGPACRTCPSSARRGRPGRRPGTAGRRATRPRSGPRPPRPSRDHSQSPDDLAAIGRDAESAALARAVRWHCEGRVFVQGRRTVVLR
ncbi:hypothetical protein GCM10022233_27600 [Streptomyces shaanxiensis]|uniref:Formyltetrahydrofolate deformylase n=1 Tax=Streptomyces shaanxiensis TaxID=653357 RepID=A0ABP7UWJ3_9ACTN